MLCLKSAKRLFSLLLPVLLIATGAFAQDKSGGKRTTTPGASAEKAATEKATAEKESSQKGTAAEGFADVDVDARENDSVPSSSTKQRTAAHFQLHPELASARNTKHASFELFPASKPARVPRLNPTADAADPQPQQPAAGGADDTAELSKKLSNPVSSLISFPVQMNFDFGMGSGGNGWRMTTNIQPVIPIALSPKWNLISRTIMPIIHQGSVVAPGTGQSGLGDIVQSFFLSPNKSEPFIWGAGPVVLIPTATNYFLGSSQLGLGPTIVVLKQQGHWTVGTLWNHIWGVAGGEGKPYVNSDFIQPFVSYSTKDGWTYGLNTESTYDWTGNAWSVPIHFNVAKIVRFGKQPISFGGQLRCWVTSPTGGPEGCGPRIVITGLFPKK